MASKKKTKAADEDRKKAESKRIKEIIKDAWSVGYNIDGGYSYLDEDRLADSIAVMLDEVRKETNAEA